MLASLTIIRYPKIFIPFALFAMAMFRLPLAFNKKISFYKLMGSGKNGSFDKHPDWQQWAIMAVHPAATELQFIQHKNLTDLYGSFIRSWIKFFNCETWTILLQPLEGHGTWDKQQPFGPLAKQTAYDGIIAILTRATIRFSRLNAFWKNVDAVALQMLGAKGFITSAGVGEMPYIKQATFSVWETKEHMKQFAYQMKVHADVIRKTRKENWYSEEMFVRFRPIATIGTIKGKDPLEGML